METAKKKKPFVVSSHDTTSIAAAAPTAWQVQYPAATAATPGMAGASAWTQPTPTQPAAPVDYNSYYYNNYGYWNQQVTPGTTGTPQPAAAATTATYYDPNAYQQQWGQTAQVWNGNAWVASTNHTGTVGAVQTPQPTATYPTTATAAPYSYSQAVTRTVSIKPAAPPTASAVPAAPAQDGTVWPDSLKAYVEAAFAKCATDGQRKTIDSKLREMIRGAIAKGDLWSRNWSEEPAPVIETPKPFNTSLYNTFQNASKGVSQNDIYKAQVAAQQRATALKNEELRKQELQKKIEKAKEEQKRQQAEMAKTTTTGNGRYFGDKQGKRERSSSPETVVTGSKAGKKKALKAAKVSAKKAKLAGPLDLNNEEETQRRTQRFSRFEDQLRGKSPSPLRDATAVYTTKKYGGGNGNSMTKQKSKSAKFGGLSVIYNEVDDESTMDLEEMTAKWKVKGTCTKLEKPYLRLTAAPDPSTVRPEPILVQALKMIKQRWLEKPDYHWTSEQLRSIRQDLTVQHIRNRFAVEVYETNARIALECKDLDQFNQCQTQLKELFRIGNQGHHMEFLSYRMLYYIFQNMRLDLDNLLREVTVKRIRDPAVTHALKVRAAIALGNYHQLFKLYLDSPNMSGHLMDIFIDRARMWALQIISKAYRPTVELEFLTKALAFDDVAECRKYLDTHGGVIPAGQTVLDCKLSCGPFAASPLMKKKL
eukprot:GILJ01003508.1.p1 GENE.GILJ01003508.1~~GILJ01003508.1.p1  ORF type:complete len:705 (+),score=142.09 GILJ01003508.1:72-2186(+)